MSKTQRIRIPGKVVDRIYQSNAGSGLIEKIDPGKMDETNQSCPSVKLLQETAHKLEFSMKNCTNIEPFRRLPIFFLFFFRSIIGRGTRAVQIGFYVHHM